MHALASYATCRRCRSDRRLALTDIVEKRVTTESLGDWLTVANGVIPITTYRLKGGAVRLEKRYQPVEHYVDAPSGMLSLVLMWLLDADRPFGHRLSLCRLESCGAFFLAKPPKKQGKWLGRYCRPEHMKEAHQLATIEYIRKRRAQHK